MMAWPRTYFDSEDSNIMSDHYITHREMQSAIRLAKAEIAYWIVVVGGFMVAAFLEGWLLLIR
jgi:hypothetical protein